MIGARSLPLPLPLPLLLLPSAAAALLLLLASSCPAQKKRPQQRTLFFRGDPVAAVEERIEDEGDGKRIARRTRLHATGDVAEIDAVVDAQGFALSARYRRGEQRVVELTERALVDGAAGITGAAGGGGSGARVLLEHPVVIIDLLRHVQPSSPARASLVDLAAGEALTGLVERRGAQVVVSDEHGGVIARCNVEGLCTGPGAFFEGDAPPALDTAPVEVAFVATARRGVRLVGVDDVVAAMELDGPGQRADAPPLVTFVPDATTRQPQAAPQLWRAPSLFIESNDAAVVSFAREHAPAAAGGDAREALVDAAKLVDAIHPLVDESKRAQPPSAKAMLTGGGDCDGAAALLVATLRALGHAARPVVGYRLVNGKFVPHAWAEVHVGGAAAADGGAGGGAGERWALVDATVPRVGADDAHLKLFGGLGSSLTMGRVLGRLRLEPAL